jgi:hypothetical protein
MLAITLESPLPRRLNKKLSTVAVFLGRGEPESLGKTSETEKIIR